MASLWCGERLIHKNPTLVLFDKDGTLIDIHHYWSSMIRIRASLIIARWFEGGAEKERVKSCLIDAMGVDIETGMMKPNGPVGIKSRAFIVNVAADIVRINGVLIDDIEMEALFSEVDKETSQDLSPLLKVLPGVKELLHRLRVCGISIKVVSTDITSRAVNAMETLALDHFFDEIIGGDAVDNTKPAPDLAYYALRKGSYDASRTVVIGDHAVDILMGQRAGIDANIGVLTGLSGVLDFDAFNCSVVNDLTAIEVRC